MRSLAFLSVFTPQRGGIADYSDDLLAALAKHFDITCYVDDGLRPAKAGRHAAIKPQTTFRGREDGTLHQIGNSTELAFVLPHLVRHGGVVTLHDACQLDFTFPYFRARRWRFAVEIFRSLDRESRRVLIKPSWNPRRVLDQAVVTYASHPEKRRLFPFTRFILRHTDRLIVHSRYLAEHARRLRPRLDTTVINLGVDPVSVGPRAGSRRFLRERLGVPVEDDTLVFLSFGVLQPHKRLGAVLRAFREFVDEHPASLYLLVGPRDPEYDLDGDLQAYGVGGRVTVLDSYLPMADVNECINAADVCFNLRWPSLGSTSSTLHKIFAVGRPVAITATESFAQYPEAFTFPVPPPPAEDEWQRCLDIMRAARDAPERIAAMGRRARHFAAGECSWDRVAERYAEVLEKE